MTETPKTQRSESKPTAEARTAYPFVHEKRTKRANGTPLDKPRYSIAVLLPKTHADPAQCANYKALWAHCIEAAQKMWPNNRDASGNWVWPQGLNPPILDGDVPYQAKAPAPGQPVKTIDPNAYNWRKGHWQIECSNFLDPGPKVAVVQNGQPVEIPAKVVAGHTMYKSGDYGFVSMNAFAWQHESGKFGVSFGFEGVLFTREGEVIGASGPKSAQAMFGTVTLPQGYAAPPAAPAAPAAPIPQQYAPPAAPVGAAPMPPLPPTAAAPGLPPLPR